MAPMALVLATEGDYLASKMMDIIRVQQHIDAWVKLQDEKKNQTVIPLQSL